MIKLIKKNKKDCNDFTDVVNVVLCGGDQYEFYYKDCMFRSLYIHNEEIYVKTMEYVYEGYDPYTSWVSALIVLKEYYNYLDAGCPKRAEKQREDFKYFIDKLTNGDYEAKNELPYEMKEYFKI